MVKLIGIALVLTITALCSNAEAQSKFALVIGNKGYAPGVGALANPHNDAQLVSDALAKIGFRVVVVRDGDQVTILREVSKFAYTLAQAGDEAVGFFYYSGHGASRPTDRTNYLLPVNVTSMNDPDIWFRSVQLDQIIYELRTNAPRATYFLVFDACRSELHVGTRGANKSFSSILPQSGIFIATSTGPNATASDGPGQSSGPYARALALELVKPGQDHLSLFQNVKAEVYRHTSPPQIGWETSGLVSRIYLNSAPAAAPAPVAVVPPSTRALLPAPERAPTISGRPATYCADLKALARLSADGFTAIRQGNPSGPHWNSSVKLAGFDSCQIRTLGSISFICYGTTQAKASAQSKLRQLVQDTEECVRWPKLTLGEMSFGFNDGSGSSVIVSATSQVSLDRNIPDPHAISINVYNAATDKAERTPDLTRPAPKKPEGYCRNLKAAVQSAENTFQDILGRKLGHKHISKVQLEGWQDCGVYLPENKGDIAYLTCELPAVATALTANTLTDEIASDVATCLGEGWVVKRRRSTNGQLNVEFQAISMKASVELRSRQSTDKSWDVKLDVNVDP